LYRELLFRRYVGSIVLLGDARERGLGLGAAEPGERTRAHLLDRLVEQRWVAAEGLGKAKLLAAVPAPCAAVFMSSRGAAERGSLILSRP
jgi:hypothetical protein